MGWAEVGAVAAEDGDPLLAGVLDRLGDQVRGIGVAAAGHRDVRRGGAGRVADGDVGAVDGLALGAVDGGGVGELDEPGRVLRRDSRSRPTPVQDQAAVLADAGHGPGLAVRDAEVGVVAAGGDAVPEPDPFAVERSPSSRAGSPVAGSARRGRGWRR